MWLTWYRKTKNNKLLWIILDFRTVILCGETHNPLIPKCSQKTKCIRVNSRILEFSDFNFVVQNVRVLEDYARLSKYFFFILHVVREVTVCIFFLFQLWRCCFTFAKLYIYSYSLFILLDFMSYLLWIWSLVSHLPFVD